MSKKIELAALRMVVLARVAILNLRLETGMKHAKTLNALAASADDLQAVLPIPPRWNRRQPVKRGAYKVRRVGKASINRGYAYWDGERWGPICSTRAYAMEIKCSTRKTQSRYQMEWLSKGIPE